MAEVWGTCPRCNERIDHLEFTEQAYGKAWFNLDGDICDSDTRDYDNWESTCPKCGRSVCASDLLDISEVEEELIEAEPLEETQDAWKGLV